MPFIQGETLASQLKRQGRMAEKAAAELVSLLARAMHVAHRDGVIHRDLKPANVMINERDEPVVMDFGLARRGGSQDTRLTADGAFLGTPAYSAPEQIGGDPETLGPACDVYSLGVMLYEMLTGRLPFHGTVNELLRSVLTQPPEPPRRHRPELDSELEEICLKALAKAPEERFVSMAAFAAALDAYAGDAPKVSPAGAPQAPATTLTLPPPTAATVAAQSDRTLDEKRGGGTSRLPPAVRWVLLIAAVGVLIGLAALAFYGLRDRTEPDAKGDRLQAGSVWSGRFKFLPPVENYEGDVRVHITERTGNRYKGKYATEGGAYEWAIDGTIENGAVRWHFTQVIREKEPGTVVGNAVVEGTVNGDEMVVVFNHKGRAEMRLRRER